jgi:hypothetical protein
MEYIVVIILLSVGLGLGILLILRELYLWYTKTNIMIKNQLETIRLLKIIVENTFDFVSPTETLNTSEN